MLSRPSSKMSRPSSRRSLAGNGNEEEDWGDDEEGDWEWEYYYEEDENNAKDVAIKAESKKSSEKPVEVKPSEVKPVQILINNEAPPIAHQRYVLFPKVFYDKLSHCVYFSECKN